MLLRRYLTGPFALAVIVTLANAAKPVVIDDTAYLIYARHIAAHPADPFGFTIFWYSQPEPAFEVLCPPVVPYWLAVGVRLFGENTAVLKLWLFPFVWLFAWAVRELLHRFARGTESVALPLVVLSPAVLPMVNLMLDIPAVGLGLTALVLFIRGADRRDWWLALASGSVAALAMQTKYTALIVPAVIGWYGLTHRRVRLALLAVVVAVAGFAAWELALVQKYGRSHFVFHATDQPPASNETSRIVAMFNEKTALIPPLAGHLGCLAVGIGLYAGRAVGFPRWAVAVAAIAWVIGVGLIAVLPHRATVLIPGKTTGHDKLNLAGVVWRSAGTAVLLTAAGCAAILLFRGSSSLRAPRSALRARFRRNPDSLFVVGWVLVELAGYFALTPFPAARRVIGLTAALGVLAARTVSRMSRVNPDRRPPRWVLRFGITVGFAVAALDAYDARPEMVFARRGAVVAFGKNPAATVWYSGHWGFQHYCEAEGMGPLIPGRTVVRPGDYLVLPVFPDADGFFRPYPGSVKIVPPADVAEIVAEFVWDDWLSAQTIANFYGGADPVIGRDHPRLRVRVYRVTKEWIVK